MVENFGEVQETGPEIEDKPDNTRKIIIIVAVVLAVLCLCACLVFFVFPTILGPVIGEVFNNIVQGIEAP